MKQILFSLFITLSLMTLLSGCKKYLDKKSNDALVIPSTLGDLQGLLDDGFTMNEVTPSLPETSADDYFLTENVAVSMPTVYKDMYTWELRNYKFLNDWSENYQPVYNSNVCLERVSEIAKTPANERQWDNVKGAALFFRAYSFLNLAWEYAKAYDADSSSVDPGIVLRLGSDFYIPSKRSTVRETYQQIITDAKESLKYLPVQVLEPMRPSIPAAFGLLSRAYLSMRMYDSSLKYAEACLSVKNELMDFNGDADITVLSGEAPFRKFNKETIFYTEMNHSVFLHTYSTCFIDTVLYSLYDSNDLRRVAFFDANSGYQKFKGGYSGNRNTLFTGIATDEIYLTKAECLIRLDKLTEGLDVLNQLILKRWNAAATYTPITAGSKDEALNLVLIERRKELLMRGLRWIDIKRLNKEGFNIIPEREFGGMKYKLPPNNNRYALPIPSDIINLTGMQQN
jgi:starch-binding outer membrane protein, SusD/RagB family